MQNRPNLYDLWREFRYLADVIDRKYLSHLEFFLAAKAGRFFGSKKNDRRPILLSSLVGFEEEIEKTPAKASTPKTTPPPSSSTPSTPKAKIGPCKPIALSTTELKKFRPQLEELGLGFLFWRWDLTVEPLVKEFFSSKSEVTLPHRGKPHEWTLAHYRRMLGRTKEQEEPGIVWDTAIQRLNMPEGVNPDDLFEEKRKENDKNGYKTKTYADPLRMVIGKSLMALFCPVRMTYLVVHKPDLHWCLLGASSLEERVAHGRRRSLYEETDPYSKISTDYSSSEDEDSSSEEEEEKTEEAKEVGEVVKDTDDDEDEGGDKGKTQVEDDCPPPSPTSPNYSPGEIVVKQMRGKKRKGKVLRFEETKTKRLASKKKKEVEEHESEEKESEVKEAELLTQIVEDGPSQVHTSTPRPSVSINLTADYLSRYFVTPFATLEEVGKKFFKSFTPGPDHLNTVNELISVIAQISLSSRTQCY
ncbi:hypothetical protein R1sor_022869 [Riccia sorocarpa]|uniref:Uncharacterized protein n=1 Tax=Riccia sorocarpa TaxID=122646 RepID=A0ABD3GLV0_9MARC